jgi:hypothetical protein
MTKDIKALIAIYTILILVGWNIALNYEIKKEFNEKIEAMTYAIELNKMNDAYTVMLDSVNSYADELVLENQAIENANKMIKELRLIK